MEKDARRIAAVLAVTTLLLGATGPAADPHTAGGGDRAGLEAGFSPEAVGLYNAACHHCRRGDPEVGASYLIRAVKAGFGDISHLRRDRDLRPLHDHPVYRAILAARDAADRLLAERRLARWRQAHGDDYTYEIDEERRLIFATTLDDPGEHRLHRTLDEQTAHLTDTLFPARRHYVLVGILTAADAATALEEPQVGGIYHHGRRELIVRDPGRSLRHELVHALHHSHMDALGQQHPLWIQEGLACLYEEYEVRPDGAVDYAANDRHNFTKTLARTGRLLPWSRIVALEKSELRVEARRVYPQLRSIFRFLAESDRLPAWYHIYVERFDEDPTGVLALERVFGEKLEELERRWRRWLDEQPIVATGNGAPSPPLRG